MYKSFKQIMLNISLFKLSQVKFTIKNIPDGINYKCAFNDKEIMTDATIVGETADCAIADFNKLNIATNEKGEHNDLFHFKLLDLA